VPLALNDCEFPTRTCALPGDTVMLTSPAAFTLCVCVAFVYPGAVALSAGDPAFVSSYQKLPVDVAPPGTVMVSVDVHGPVEVVENAPAVELELSVVASELVGACESCSAIGEDAEPATSVCAVEENASVGCVPHR
jgi:hypothetical protein